MLHELTRLRDRRTGRVSSWDTTGRNDDAWNIEPGEARTLAEIDGPAQITHLWMTQPNHYRECLLRFYWDGAKRPSIDVPLGDFFCLGHGLVNSFQTALFTASTHGNNRFNVGCALNAYVPMPFREHCRVELVNQSKQTHRQYFYVDYETLGKDELEQPFGYFHAEFRRTNPFGGWGHEVRVNTPEANVVNKAKTAWENNYLILETKGRGHYIGCNLSVTNFQGTWWGEGDDMIWVDGYKWPPDLHGTGSEDYLNQAWGMQPNAYLRNGSSIYEGHTRPTTASSGGWPRRDVGGYQTSYVFHLENPVRFRKEIKVTIEHGHGNHLQNEMSSVAYWYAEKPTRVARPPAVARRRPVLQDSDGNWLQDKANQCPGPVIEPSPEMKKMKRQWSRQHG
jgi:hypothetical protein